MFPGEQYVIMCGTAQVGQMKRTAYEQVVQDNSNVMIPPYVYHLIAFVIIPWTVCMEMMNTFANSQYLPALPIAPV